MPSRRSKACWWKYLRWPEDPVGTNMLDSSVYGGELRTDGARPSCGTHSPGPASDRCVRTLSRPWRDRTSFPWLPHNLSRLVRYIYLRISNRHALWQVSVCLDSSFRHRNSEAHCSAALLRKQRVLGIGKKIYRRFGDYYVPRICCCPAASARSSSWLGSWCSGSAPVGICSPCWRAHCWTRWGKSVSTAALPFIHLDESWRHIIDFLTLGPPCHMQPNEA